MSEPKLDVIVIGGGLAGLTAALHLAERGLNVTVLEADPQFPGGRVSSRPAVEFDGWRFPGEHGVHGIWSPYVNLQAMLARNRIRPVFVPAQEEDWIYRRGNRLRKAKVGSAMRQSWLPAPFHYLNLFLRPSFLATIELRDFISLISVWYLLIFAVGADPLKEGYSFGKLKLQDMIYYWSPALRAFMIGLTRSGLSAQPEEIPLSGYLAFLRFYSVMRRDAWVFSYLPQGGGISLIDPIVERLQALGGTVHLGRSVTRIENQQDDWQVTWQSTENDQQTGTLTAPQIILATDAPNTARILQNSPATAPKAAHLEFPRGMETAIVRFWFDAKPRSTSEAGIFTGDFMLDNFFWLDQIMEPYLSWGRQTGGCALEAHIYGPPELLAEPDALILAKAQNGILAAFPELRGHKITQILQRNQATHTLFGVGEAEVHLGIQTPWPNLYCCGDWVRDPNPALFLERAVTTGILAANEVLKQNNKPQWPLIPHPAPEPFVAWIETLMQRGRKKKKAKLS
jgi:carotenoid phi-ring synthase / carotenoid chi-ring synthase